MNYYIYVCVLVFALSSNSYSQTDFKKEDLIGKWQISNVKFENLDYNVAKDSFSLIKVNDSVKTQSKPPIFSETTLQDFKEEITRSCRKEGNLLLMIFKSDSIVVSGFNEVDNKVEKYTIDAPKSILTIRGNTATEKNNQEYQVKFYFVLKEKKLLLQSDETLGIRMIFTYIKTD